MSNNTLSQVVGAVKVNTLLITLVSVLLFVGFVQDNIEVISLCLFICTINCVSWLIIARCGCVAINGTQVRVLQKSSFAWSFKMDK